MRPVTYSMNTSLDGFIEDREGRFDWSVPDDEVFAAHLDELSRVDVHLLGRRLHETMLYWETVDDATLNEAEQEWGRRWRALPKVVFSTTLTEVEGSNTRLATGTLAEEVARLRAEPGEGEIAIGGATLAAQAAAEDLIDEYVVKVHPVIVGGGRPYFPRDGRHVDLELVELRRFDCGIFHQRHRVKR